MKKNKVINIVLLSLAGTILLAGAILGFVDPHLLKRILDYVKELLNQPLPIIGITVGACLIFLWKLIITSNYGKKKIAIYDQKIKELDKAYQEFVDKTNSKVAFLERENKELTTKLANACKLSTNKKIKDYGKELDAYGKETIECETKAD